MEKGKRQVIILPRLRQSVVEIWEYINNDSPKNADNFVFDLEPVVSTIEKFPLAYPSFKPLAGKRKLYRFRVYKKSYLIVFKVLNEKLIFIDVLHGHRSVAFMKSLQTTDY